MTCYNCDKSLTPLGTGCPILIKLVSWLDPSNPERTYYLCSYDCVAELGWKLREQQPKLSKSTITQSE